MTWLDVSLGDRTLKAHISSDGKVHIADASFAVSVAGPGVYRVSDDTRHWMVAVAGTPDNRWLHVDGLVAQIEIASAAAGSSVRAKPARSAPYELSAPMPATVIRVLVEVGSAVTRGQTLIMLEAMKMELPVRAPRDGVVKAVHCKAGELVQPGVNLLDLV
jgi:3-methylcrotonyl-CoA carboxylase alpha subunit